MPIQGPYAQCQQPFFLGIRAILPHLPSIPVSSTDSSNNLMTIAKITGVSASTVLRTLNDTLTFHAARKLPVDLCFDELRTTHGWMSFICVDAHTHRLVTMLGDRYNASYQALVHEVFPNAEVVFDRFHIVQPLGRAMDQVRIQCMKTLELSDRVHKAMKSYWRLFHKANPEARKRTYKFALKEIMTEQEVIDIATNTFPEFKHAYEAYISIHETLTHGRFEELNYLIEQYTPNGSVMYVAINTLKKNLKGVLKAATCKLSNCPIEGINRKIKELKRTCYGFSNQLNMFKRIYQITA